MNEAVATIARQDSSAVLDQPTESVRKTTFSDVTKRIAKSFSWRSGVLVPTDFHFAIDLGTQNARIARAGVILRNVPDNEKSDIRLIPTYIATDERLSSKDKVWCFGEEAKSQHGKMENNREIDIVKIVDGGKITRQKAAGNFIYHLMKKYYDFDLSISSVCDGMRAHGRIIIGLPPGASMAERREMKEYFSEVTGATIENIVIVDQTTAAMVGGGALGKGKSDCSAVIDAGGGTTDIAIMNNRRTVGSKTIPVAGDAFDEAIQSMVRSKYKLEISILHAEVLKKKIGTAIHPDKLKVRPTETTCKVTGKSTTDHLPHTVEVKMEHVYQALNEPIGKIEYGFSRILEDMPAGLVEDLINNGVVLTGGTGCLLGLDERLSAHSGQDVNLAPNARTAVIEGLIKIQGDTELLKKVMLM